MYIPYRVYFIFFLVLFVYFRHITKKCFGVVFNICRHYYTGYHEPKKLGNLLMIPYNYNGVKYYALVPAVKRTKMFIISTTNLSGETVNIKPYLGINDDFYGQMVTPGMMGFDGLKIKFMDGVNIIENTFLSGESIVFKKIL